MGQWSPWQRVLAVVFVTATLFFGGLNLYLRGRFAESPADAAVFQPEPLPPVIREEPYLRIHIAGAVAKPGVYNVYRDDRVIDAIEQAGGARTGAKLDDLNLAAHLRDGMRLYIPGPNDGPADEVVVVTEDVYVHAPPPARDPEQPPDSGERIVTDLGTVSDGTKPKASGAGSERKQLPSSPININSASLEELQQLPGIGPAMARRILAYRETVGPFRSPGQLVEVKGIGEKTYAKMAPYVTVE